MLPRLAPTVVLALASLAHALPARVTLQNIRYEPQGFNNCAPVTALTVLGYYGTRVTQRGAANALKDGPNDFQVSTSELAAYLGRFGLRSVIRYAGDADTLRALVSRGFPVVVQQRLYPGGNVAHFRTIYGYTPGGFLASDPLRGPELRLSPGELADLWHFYNGEYLVAYPPKKEAEVRAALGEDFDLGANWRHLKAIEEQNVKASPQDPYGWWGLGKANLRLGDAAGAAQDFARAVRIGVPTEYYWYRQEAFEAWDKAGEYAKTLTEVNRALRTYPNSKELLHYRDAARSALANM